MNELQLQSKIWRWFYDTYAEYRLPPAGKQPRCLLVHNYNNPRSVVSGSQLASAGLSKGFPDLTLYIPNLMFTGLIMELKVEGQKPKKEQWDYLDKLEDLGYYTCWCDTFEKAKSEIENYLSYG